MFGKYRCTKEFTFYALNTFSYVGHLKCLEETNISGPTRGLYE